MNETDQTDNILDSICIAMPCSVDWSQMKGNDEIRLCSGCNKNVYNISAISKMEAESILSAPTLPCIQLFRQDDGVIVTDERPRLVRLFWSYGKSAVSAMLSLIAVISPQLAAASDDKLKQFDVKGKPAKVTILGGRPMVSRNVPRNQNYKRDTKLAIDEYPSSLSVIGIAEKDLSVDLNCDNAESSRQMNPATIKVSRITGQSIPSQLNVENWNAFEAGREEHARACFHMLNSQGEDSWSACEKARKLYAQALTESSGKKLDKAFLSFVRQELAKVRELQAKSVRKY